MSTINLKKQTKVYIVYNSNRYEIDISNITFSQTFTENSYPVKTLHEQDNMFEGSVVNKANPANFDLSLPLLADNYHSILFTLANTYPLPTFDIYISNPNNLYRLVTCAITNFSFSLNKTSILSVDISGQAAILEKYSESGTYPEWNIPGAVQAKPSIYDYNIVHRISANVDSVDIENIYNASIELQNNITWTPYTTVNNAITTVDRDTTMYPTDFTVGSRIFAGSISRYLIDDSTQQIWNTNVPVTIQAGEYNGSTILGLDIDIPEASFTNRMSSDEIFTQHYEWRMTSNPTDFNTVLGYVPD